jgi:hypothetical protein
MLSKWREQSTKFKWTAGPRGPAVVCRILTQTLSLRQAGFPALCSRGLCSKHTPYLVKVKQPSVA